MLPSGASCQLRKQQDANILFFFLHFFSQANDQMRDLGGKLFIAISNLVSECCLGCCQCGKRQSWEVG